MSGAAALGDKDPLSDFSPESLANIQATGAEAVASGEVPGVLSLVWRKGEIVQVSTAGFADVERKAPIERSTIFAIASMTKPVTVAAALMLVEDGVIELDDPITKWAPEFAEMRVLARADGPLDDTYPAPRPITIEDLMTHRSGLSYSVTAEGPLAAALTEKLGMEIVYPQSPDDWMRLLASFPLAYAPGERFQYGHSTDVLGFIVGRAAGTSFRQFLLNRVFGPLGMADTDFWIPPEKRHRAATAYVPTLSGSFEPAAVEGLVGPQVSDYTSGGQGLVSTADDYLTFARMLLGGGEVGGVRLLQPETVALMTTDRLTPAQRQNPFMGMPFWAGQGFGLGVSVITDPAQHWLGAGNKDAFSWAGAFGGWWQADPRQEMVLIWLQQILPAAPAPGAPPRMPPGMAALMAFQRATYAALSR
ncbi:MAG TPA: serine hydrolase domain-containing protein [Caulobacteraceae bacterium]|jgi:CubicO group peptidase (beta-lactamase class C family)